MEPRQDGIDSVALDIPSMGGTEIGPLLRKLASEAPPGGNIVEVGSWLGAGTAQLALGVRDRSDPPILHCYDYWEASESEVAEAGRNGIELQQGQDTLPFVRSRLEQISPEIVYHKGPIQDIVWTDGDISLYVDDAAKDPTNFHHVLTTFGPSWTPGVTVLVLMDYYYWKQKTGYEATFYRSQTNFIEANPRHFQRLPDLGRHIPGFREIEGTQSSTEAFLYTRPFDFAALKPFAIPKNYRAMLPPVIRRPLGRISRLLWR